MLLAYISSLLLFCVRGLRVTTFNTFIRSNDDLRKAIEGHDSDVYFLQEINYGFLKNHLGPQIAKAYVKYPSPAIEFHIPPHKRSSNATLYAYVAGQNVILTRHEAIRMYSISTLGRPMVGVDMMMDGQIIHLWNVHLKPYPYGPYAVCNSRIKNTGILDFIERIRTDQLDRLMNNVIIRSALQTRVPILLAGDFNSPSHLDWTTEKTEQNCNHAYDWPTSRLVQEKFSFNDAFRTVYPDPTEHPGNTWSPMHRFDKQDRIDYIYYRGNLCPFSAAVLPQRDQYWPSDHASVTVDFLECSVI